MILGVTPHKGDSFNGRFSEPLPFAFVFEALPQNCLGSCRFECFMFAGHKAVIHIEICAALEKLRTATCSRHMVNLCVLRLLSPKGRRGGMGPMPRSVPHTFTGFSLHDRKAIKTHLENHHGVPCWSIIVSDSL